MRLVLASGSPRRRDLLLSVGLEFDVHVPTIDERPLHNETPRSYVERLARQKALTAAGPGRVVLGADTTVVHEGTIIGKPRDPEDARRILARLQGDTHSVYTGVAVAWQGEGEPEVRVEVEGSEVKLVPINEAEIVAYVDTGEPLDKAGAYALQGVGAMFVDSVRGSPTNVVGLHLPSAVRLLRSAGVDVMGRSR
ncbi:MAG: Maf family protein [bacterium]|nr:Maf family protein [bacterium]